MGTSERRKCDERKSEVYIDSNLSMITAVSERSSTAKVSKAITTVENALKIVENLEHRAGKDAEGKTGDGVGILLQISHKFFTKDAAKLAISRSEKRENMVSRMLFFPQDELKRNQAKKMFEIIVEKEGHGISWMA